MSESKLTTKTFLFIFHAWATCMGVVAILFVVSAGCARTNGVPVLPHGQGWSLTVVRTITTASEKYEENYGYLPRTGTNSSIVNSGTLFVNCMKGTDTNLNPRGILFFDMPPRSLRGPVGFQILVDSYSTPFSIYYDTNGDGFVSEADAGAPKFNGGSLNRTIAVWSWGPNRVNEWGDGDDIRSW
jgi:hypothetical protein